MIDNVAGQGQTGHCEKLLDALIQGWSALKATSPGELAEPVPQRAYLLFNRWNDNPLAQELEEKFPKWASDRIGVPDSYFERREEHAPFLLEVPETLTIAAMGSTTRDLRAWLTRCLVLAEQQANERLTTQDFCGVVISTASEQMIARHWAMLGHQQVPGREETVLFRYQDPRVMQRVWPVLSPLQQSRWLGPVGQWWSLVQPWGPFNDPPRPAQWFHAKAPVLPHGVEPGGYSRNLFDQEQWFLSGISPQANLIWRSYAEHNIPRAAQPDPDSLLQMLADAARMKLKNLDLEDYVWITWMHTPKEGPARAIDWRLPHLAPTLNWIEAQLIDSPDARFSSLFAEATQPRR